MIVGESSPSKFKASWSEEYDPVVCYRLFISCLFLSAVVYVFPEVSFSSGFLIVMVVEVVEVSSGMRFNRILSEDHRGFFKFNLSHWKTGSLICVLGGPCC